MYWPGQCWARPGSVAFLGWLSQGYFWALCRGTWRTPLLSLMPSGVGHPSLLCNHLTSLTPTIVIVMRTEDWALHIDMLVLVISAAPRLEGVIMAYKVGEWYTSRSTSAWGPGSGKGKRNFSSPLSRSEVKWLQSSCTIENSLIVCCGLDILLKIQGQSDCRLYVHILYSHNKVREEKMLIMS